MIKNVSVKEKGGNAAWYKRVFCKLCKILHTKKNRHGKAKQWKCRLALDGILQVEQSTFDKKNIKIGSGKQKSGSAAWH